MLCIYQSLSNHDGDGQQEQHKTIGLMSKNNVWAHAFYVLVHLFAVPFEKMSKTMIKL